MSFGNHADLQTMPMGAPEIHQLLHIQWLQAFGNLCVRGWEKGNHLDITVILM